VNYGQTSIRRRWRPSKEWVGFSWKAAQTEHRRVGRTPLVFDRAETEFIGRAMAFAVDAPPAITKSAGI
jgi:hypothetical protein